MLQSQLIEADQKARVRIAAIPYGESTQIGFVFLIMDRMN